MKTIAESAKEMLPQLIEIRRDLHRHPELSCKEYRTTRLISEHLQKLGIEVIPWGGETGVVGLLRGGEPGPVIGLRADIDALPIQEQNDCEYRSTVDGVMHACGHDAHTAWLLGAAELLAARRHELKGSVKFIFQPAEELAVGAKTMMSKKVLENPRVDVIFGVHNTPNLPAGQVGLKDGPLMANSINIAIAITGKGGHGSAPHKTHDPIMAAAAIIQGLQTIVSRRVDPLEPCVISFGSIHGGQANNVIPEVVELTGTVRTFQPALTDELAVMMRELIDHIAIAHGVETEFVFRQVIPAVINTPDLVAWVRAPLAEIFGEEGVVRPQPVMGAEDFAFFLESVPGAFLFLGVGNTEKGIVNQWHNAKFDVDESSLALGAGGLAQIAFDWLKR